MQAGATPAVTTTPTPVGPARLHRYAAPRHRRAVLVLGHGAGGGVHVRDLQALAAALPPRGVDVVLVEQPWCVAGRLIADRPAQLDEAWCAALAGLRAADSDVPLVVGGRSAGARVACRTAADVAATAVLALAFPLHPPGRPERSRADELVAPAVPVTVVQGSRDAFGTGAEVRAVAGFADPARVTVYDVPWADHSFAVPGRAPLTAAEALDTVVAGAWSAVLRAAAIVRRTGMLLPASAVEGAEDRARSRRT